MNILLVSSEFPPGPGGIGTHAYQLAKQFDERGRAVGVCTPQDYASEEEVTAFNAAQPFAVHRLRAVPGAPLKAVYRGMRLAHQIRVDRPDVLLASGKRAVWMTAVVAERFGLPWIAVGHGTEFSSPVSWDRKVSRWAYQRAHAVVCVSAYTHGQMEAMGIRPRRSHVIPNGADAEQYRPLARDVVAQYRRELGLDQAMVLLTVGRVAERKGQDVVIKALPHILEKVPNTYYLMAGLPECEAAFSALARRLDVAGHVRFLGRVGEDEAVRLQNSCDVFVMVSKRTAEGDVEGYGIAVIEAALCGKAAVVSSDSGLTEAIQPGVTGYAVPPNDEHATATAILSLLGDAEQRRQMGEAARTRALGSQTWTHCARRYDALLRDLVTPHPAGVGPAIGHEG